MLKKIVLGGFIAVASLVSFQMGHSGQAVSGVREARADDPGWCGAVGICATAEGQAFCEYCRDGSTGTGQ